MRWTPPRRSRNSTCTYGENEVMAFTDSQTRLLKAKLDPRYVRTRNSNGSTLSYVEGWHAIAEANRIFGYEAWDRRTVSASCVWTEAKAGTYRTVYTAKVRIM